MGKTTHEVRMAKCHARREGQSVKHWLADNGISKINYYYWQRKIQQETYALISSTLTPPAEPKPVAYAELPFISPKEIGQSFSPDAVMRRGQTVLELSNTVSDRLLDRLMEVVRHA